MLDWMGHCPALTWLLLCTSYTALAFATFCCLMTFLHPTFLKQADGDSTVSANSSVLVPQYAQCCWGSFYSPTFVCISVTPAFLPVPPGAFAHSPALSVPCCTVPCPKLPQWHLHCSGLILQEVPKAWCCFLAIVMVTVCTCHISSPL